MGKQLTAPFGWLFALGGTFDSLRWAAWNCFRRTLHVARLWGAAGRAAGLSNRGNFATLLALGHCDKMTVSKPVEKTKKQMKHLMHPGSANGDTVHFKAFSFGLDQICANFWSTKLIATHQPYTFGNPCSVEPGIVFHLSQTGLWFGAGMEGSTENMPVELWKLEKTR